MDRRAGLGPAGLRSTDSRFTGQAHGERRAVPQLALDLDLPSLRDDQRADQPQAQADSGKVVVRGRAFEPFKDALLVATADANAVVPHDQLGLAALLPHRHVYRRAGPVLEG